MPNSQPSRTTNPSPDHGQGGELGHDGERWCRARHLIDVGSRTSVRAPLRRSFRLSRFAHFLSFAPRIYDVFLLKTGGGESRGPGFGSHAVLGSSSFGLRSAKAKEIAGSEEFTEHGRVARDAHFLVQRER